MNTPNTIHDFAAAHEGAELILTVTAEGVADVAGSDAYQAAAAVVLSLFDHVVAPKGLRVSIESDPRVTIHALDLDGDRAAIVAPTNHPISKSVKRILRTILGNLKKAPREPAPKAAKPRKQWF